jgi:seryl-tRNA synthetase
MFAFTTPEKSEEIHKEMLSIEEELFSELGLHYRFLFLFHFNMRSLLNIEYWKCQQTI